MLSDDESKLMVDSIEDYKVKFIGELIKQLSSTKLEAVAAKLSELSRADLDKKTLEAKIQGSRIPLWLLNREYTKRGISPIFRKLSLKDENVPQYDLLWYDLEWLSANYQGHQPFLTRWSKIFALTNFSHSTAGLIYSEMKSEMWRNVKSLALKNEWQVELNVLKKEIYSKQYSLLVSNKEEVRNRLRAFHHSRKTKLSIIETNILIDRRLNIWICASLAECKPQRTANLYKKFTGLDITRQNADKIIGQVKRDVSDAFKKIDLT